MSWQTLSIEVPGDRVEAAEDAMLESGALSVTLSDAGDDPVLETAPGETPLWPHVRLSGLFAQDADPDETRLRLAAALGNQGLDVVRMELPDREWSRAWMDRFGPMRFGSGLWIVPRGTQPPSDGGVIIRLDPGLAFGSGTHPTTSLCLEWLDAHGAAGLTVVDFGCGSGVLGIGAALLGARTVWCVDHDKQALRATRENAEFNGVGDRITVRLPEEMPSLRADLLLANILYRPLRTLSRKFSEMVPPGGTIVMSGVLADQVEELKRTYSGHFGHFEIEELDGWARVAGNRLD